MSFIANDVGGLKKIEEIREGDLVLAYDEETGEQAYKPVVQLFRNETKEWYHVREQKGIRCLHGRTPVPYSDRNGKPKSRPL